MNSSPKATNPQSAPQAFTTNDILGNIKKKLLFSDQSSQQQIQQVPQSSPSNARPQANTPASLQPNNFTYEDFGDFQMNDDIGNESRTSFNSSNQSPELNAAYRAYQANKYSNAIAPSPTNKENSKNSHVNAFAEFEDYSMDDSESNHNDSEFEEPQNNVRTFPARSQNLARHTRPNANTSNSPMKNQKDLYSPNGSESINSVMSRMLQQEIANYISTWAGQNNQVFTRYLQEACDQIAQEWCNTNMPSLMNNAVKEWCEKNLEKHCSDVIREELHKVA